MKRVDFPHCRYCISPACVNCATARSFQPLLAAGFAGLGCIRTLMLTAESFSASRARHSLYLPIATTLWMQSRRTISTRARSHAVFSCVLTSTGRSGGVTFLAFWLRNSNGHRLCTKQRRKNFSGVTQSCCSNFQNRAPLTWKTQVNTYLTDTGKYLVHLTDS